MQIVALRYTRPIEQLNSPFLGPTTAQESCLKRFKEATERIPNEPSFAPEMADLQRTWHARPDNGDGFVQTAARQAHRKGWNVAIYYGSIAYAVRNVTHLTTEMIGFTRQYYTTAMSLIIPDVRSFSAEETIVGALAARGLSGTPHTIFAPATARPAPYFELVLHVD